MKLTNYPQYRADRGSVLLVALGMVVVLGIAIASVLGLVTHENRILARTSAWNAALPMAEAGIEEAMSHMRKVDGGPRGVNGWQASSSSFVMNRYLSDSRYVVGISSATPPVVMSVGQVWCPSAGRYIERRVQVTTRGQGTFMKGLVARDWIKMSGQVESDSFDSGDPRYSTNGLYIASKRKDNGDVASNKNSAGALEFSGQIKIYGHIATGPAGTVVNSGVTVGTTNFIAGGGSGIQAGHYTKDMNVSFPAVIAPYTNGPSPSSAVVGGVSYKYVLNDGMDYRMSTLVLSGSDKVLVSGKARLLVDKDISISGSAFIRIATNANMQLYVKAGAVSISGNAVANQTGNAANFSLLGLPSVQDIVFSGDGSLIGTIYAPSAKLNMSGGSSTGLDFSGAAIVNQVDASGQYKFHYDEALGSNSARNLVIASWQEL